MVTDPWAAREKGIADYHRRISESARHKQQAPQRAWDKLESLTNQAVSGPLDASQEQEFKQARRDWNRQYKNTPVGIEASGVNLGADPFGAQDLYHDMSSLMYHDQPKMYDRMYPLNPTRLISGLAKNIGPGGWLNRILPKRERKVPANVLSMQDRFPGINEITPEGMDKVIPPYGIAPLVPEHIRNSTLWGINKAVEEEEGIFGGVGRGDLADDFDYEDDRESRELAAKIAFLESVNPNIDYDDADPLLIDEAYEKALQDAEMDEFMSGNIGALNPLQPDFTEN
jgi:hypothetical protein